jgi:hypothetical protein
LCFRTELLLEVLELLFRNNVFHDSSLVWFVQKLNDACTAKAIWRWDTTNKNL